MRIEEEVDFLVVSSIETICGLQGVSLNDDLAADLSIDSLMLVLVLTEICNNSDLNIMDIDERKFNSLKLVGDIKEIFNK